MPIGVQYIVFPLETFTEETKHLSGFVRIWGSWMRVYP